MEVTQLPGFVKAMLRPEWYSHRPDSVEFVQTHISFVFLAGDRVYKVKKPVKFAFLDFSTLALRRFYCEEEVRLNRRLAGDVYRGVVAIRSRGESYELADASSSDAIEYAVEMTRLPQDRMFSEILRRGEATTEHVGQIVARLVEFHREADCSETVARNGSPETLQAMMDLDFSESGKYRGRTVSSRVDSAIQHFCCEFVAMHDLILRERQAGGFIRECHGDLRAEHICIGDRLWMIDCIEFAAKFRNRDVAAEVAFLAMDLEFLGYDELAAYLVEEYARASGDEHLAFLVPFYQCYFAYIRGKVESLKGLEAEVDAAERKLALESAKRHFELAGRKSWAYAPMIIAVTGLSGTGKTTIAEGVRARTGFVHLDSDAVRKELAGLATDRPSGPQSRAQLYDEEHGRRTYTELVTRASSVLRSGRGVVLDGTYQRRSNRDEVCRLAEELSVPLLFVQCVCGEDEVRRRLDLRVRSGRGPSDAGWDVYLRQRDVFEVFGADESSYLLTVDSSRSGAEIINQIEDAARTQVCGR